MPKGRRWCSATRVNDILNASLPCRIKINAGDRRENVNANRLAAHAKKGALFREVGGGQSLERRPELRQGFENRLGVVRVRFHQNIEVLGCPRLGVNRDGVCPNDKVFNAVRVQNGQEFFEVWVHPEPRPSSHSVLG
jgi:hypothetical protein